LDKQTVIDAQYSFIQNEEQQWILLAQQGDQQAFHQLYLKYHRKIYALCWRMLAEKESAEDACQEAFVQIWRNLSMFKGNSQFYTWAHSVATNCVLGYIRKHKTWWQTVFSQEPNVEVHDQLMLEDATSQIEAKQLDAHIAKLPERARLVFVLFAIEGYRHEEIATMMNMAVGSSKAQYHRARQLLKAWLTA